MPDPDVNKSAEELIGRALAARGRLGYLAKISKKSYGRAVDQAADAFEVLRATCVTSRNALTGPHDHLPPEESGREQITRSERPPGWSASANDNRSATEVASSALSAGPHESPAHEFDSLVETEYCRRRGRDLGRSDMATSEMVS